MKSSRKKKLGATLVETVLATSISVLVMAGGLSIFLAGTSSWATGLGELASESDAQMAVRAISKTLSEAMSVTVDANGQGLTYQLAQVDSTGNYVVPLTWDGVTRRIQSQSGTLVMIDNGVRRTLTKNLILTDPLSSGGTAPYQIFTPGVGAVTRQVTIEVATQCYGFNNHKVSNRNRETIYLRNVPLTH